MVAQQDNEQTFPSANFDGRKIVRLKSITTRHTFVITDEFVKRFSTDAYTAPDLTSYLSCSPCLCLPYYPAGCNMSFSSA